MLPREPPPLRTTNPLEERVVALLEPDAEALGYRLVRVRLLGARRKTLQIMAERKSDGDFNSGDCTKLARRANEALEAIEYDSLEVSSPGIDRPLMRIEDFARFTGHTAKLETTAMIDGQKRFKGEIAGIEGDTIRLATERGEVKLKFSALHDARLVLTDKLIEEDLRRAKQAEREDVLPREGEVSRGSATEGAAAHPSGDRASTPSVSLPADSSPSRGSTARDASAMKKRTKP